MIDETVEIPGTPLIVLSSMTDGKIECILFESMEVVGLMLADVARHLKEAYGWDETVILSSMAMELDNPTTEITKLVEQ